MPAFCVESLKPRGPYETGTTLETPAPTGCSLLWPLGSHGPHQIRWISFLLSTSKQIEMFGFSLKVTLGLILFKKLSVPGAFFIKSSGQTPPTQAVPSPKALPPERGCSIQGCTHHSPLPPLPPEDEAAHTAHTAHSTHVTNTLCKTQLKLWLVWLVAGCRPMHQSVAGLIPGLGTHPVYRFDP